MTTNDLVGLLKDYPLHEVKFGYLVDGNLIIFDVVKAVLMAGDQPNQSIIVLQDARTVREQIPGEALGTWTYDDIRG